VVVNFENEITRKIGIDAALDGKQAVFFSSKRGARELLSAVPEGCLAVFEREGSIFISNGTDESALLSVASIKVPGRHNVENFMTAIALTYGAVDNRVYEAVAASFSGVEHRLEFVREVNGVKYYNDSKGTNTDAAIKAIDAMPGTTVLIGGGYDKDADFSEWVSHFPGKVRKLVLIGQTAEKIAKACDDINFSDYCFAESLEEAVKLCADSAQDGDCCLLSPACASWGMFKCYQQRGDMFKEYVNAIEM
jgi:UDP-N-acetylmuramoylalanine--D-glutamate ligase